MTKSLKGNRILITAGPTREYLDPVRYISNDSSGKMGYALARAAKKMGGKVILISGPTNLTQPQGIKFISAITAGKMHNAALKESKDADLIICAAAVADFRPKSTPRQKIKKDPWPMAPDSESTIKLIKNPDILKSLGQKKKKHQILVGFALETENIIPNAQRKMADKKCDFIIANKKRNIGSDTGSALLLSKYGQKINLKRQHKRYLARNILKYIYEAPPDRT